MSYVNTTHWCSGGLSLNITAPSSLLIRLPLILSFPRPLSIIFAVGGVEKANTASENMNTSMNFEIQKTKERGRDVTREITKENENEKGKGKDEENDRSPSPTSSLASTTKSSSKSSTPSTSKVKKEKESKKRFPITINSVIQDSTSGPNSTSTPRPVTTPQIIPTLAPSPNALLFVDPLFDTLPWEGLRLLEKYFGGIEKSFKASSFNNYYEMKLSLHFLLHIFLLTRDVFLVAISFLILIRLPNCAPF